MTLREYLRVILLGARNYTDLKYQQKKDIKLQTENKTIVGAINEVNDSIKNVAPGMTEEQAQQLEENTEAIRQLSEDIANLKNGNLLNVIQEGDTLIIGGGN